MIKDKRVVIHLLYVGFVSYYLFASVDPATIYPSYLRVNHEIKPPKMACYKTLYKSQIQILPKRQKK